MKICVEVKMSAMVVVLFLALGVSNGLVIDKCELGEDLNLTLPAKILDQINNVVAKIVCHVELSSHLNTSTINYVTGPNIKSFIRGGRKGRSAESSNEESSEEDIQKPNNGFSSLIVNPITRPEGNISDSDEAQSGRKHRSAESSSQESSEEDILRRTVRSAKTSNDESDGTTTWTLYGLFQLPDRIACTSGFEPSLNLCSMNCDSLIDDNIQDDIACVEIILTKMLSTGGKNGRTKAIFHKLAAAFFQKECKNVENSAFFSTC